MLELKHFLTSLCIRVSQTNVKVGPSMEFNSCHPLPGAMLNKISAMDTLDCHLNVKFKSATTVEG